jgi:glycosyltransferase involved in cell wall biosynthesis
VKILVNCVMPFALAHGGQAIQTEQTMAALQAVGLTVEPVRWWDRQQTGDVIHYVGRMPTEQIRFARQKKIRVVMAEFLTAQGSRSFNRLRFQKLVSRSIARLAPRSFTNAFNWDAYRMADAFVANTSWEKFLMEYLFGAHPEKVHVVPNGVEAVFFNSPPVQRASWLVCAATLTERKRVVELAEAAVMARTPVWIIGSAYAENDPYSERFQTLAKANPRWIRFEGAIGDRNQLAGIYRAARGFVLLSTMETRSLSSEEAAACECPLLLSDLPWARSTFGEHASYCPVTNAIAVTARRLREFYDAAPGLPPPPKPATWNDVGRQFKEIYEKLLNSSLSV